MADQRIWVSPNGNDSNSGSASAPLRTIQAALNDASRGTDVMVKAGVYTGNLKFNDNDVALISGSHHSPVQPECVHDQWLRRG
jgi:pectin methylesterase-like acyl-CoA thioesterase